MSGLATGLRVLLFWRFTPLEVGRLSPQRELLLFLVRDGSCSCGSLDRFTAFAGFTRMRDHITKKEDSNLFWLLLSVDYSYIVAL